MVTSVELKKILSYDPETGEWVFVTGAGSKKAGDKAGHASKRGYVQIGINHKLYSAHRLAFLYMTGEFPAGLVDHKDLNKSNNKWDNLRLTNKSGNSMNRTKSSSNTSGHKGVSWDKITSKWVVRIQVDGIAFNVGRFDCPAAASLAYQIAADKYFGEFARHN